MHSGTEGNRGHIDAQDHSVHTLAAPPLLHSLTCLRMTSGMRCDLLPPNSESSAATPSQPSRPAAAGGSTLELHVEDDPRWR